MWGDAANMWGEVVKGLQMACSLDKSEFKRGETIILIILTRNAGSEETISLTETNPLRDYEVSVTMLEPQQAVLDLTETGRSTLESARSGELFRRKRVNLGPRETYEQTIPLSEWFELKLAGEYEVLATRPGWIDNGRTLTAPPIKFRVR